MTRKIKKSFIINFNFLAGKQDASLLPIPVKYIKMRFHGTNRKQRFHWAGGTDKSEYASTGRPTQIELILADK